MRALLRPGWLAFSAFAAAMAALFLWLGFWQMDRSEQRRSQDLEAAAAEARQPVPAGSLLRPGVEPAGGVLYRHVVATGSWDAAGQVLVRNRPRDAGNGFLVVTPLVTRDGPALLVERGWVKAGDGPGGLPGAVPQPQPGTVTVKARVRASEPAADGAPLPAGQVQRIDVAGIGRPLGVPVYGGYGELISETPAPADPATSGLLPPDLAPEAEQGWLTVGRHIAYAAQWWIFTVIALVGWLILARREVRDGGSQAAEDAAAVAAARERARARDRARL